MVSDIDVEAFIEMLNEDGKAYLLNQVLTDQENKRVKVLRDKIKELRDAKIL